MTVSIIIPTRNRAVFLKECLKRLASQVGKDDEVLVIDNEGQDNTKSVVLGFQDRFPIKYFFEPKKGSSFARNLGAKKAKNEVLIFLDDDCLVSPNWLKEAKALSKVKNCVIQGKIIHQFAQKDVFADVFWFYYYLTRKRILEQKKKEKHLLRIDYLDAGNILVKKNFLKKIGYWFDEKLFPFIGEQKELFLRIQKESIVIYGTTKMKVTHIKERKGLIKSLIGLISRAFYSGRAEEILTIKYPLSKKIKILFKREIEQIQKKKKKEKQLFVSSLKSLLRNKEFSYKIAFLILLIIRKISFLLGKVYGFISYKARTYLSLSVLARMKVERVSS